MRLIHNPGKEAMDQYLASLKLTDNEAAEMLDKYLQGKYDEESG
jgi:hypothetical protein